VLAQGFSAYSQNAIERKILSFIHQAISFIECFFRKRSIAPD
jgi:hypothetical protein